MFQIRTQLQRDKQQRWSVQWLMPTLTLVSHGSGLEQKVRKISFIMNPAMLSLTYRETCLVFTAVSRITLQGHPSQIQQSMYNVSYVSNFAYLILSHVQVFLLQMTSYTAVKLTTCIFIKQKLFPMEYYLHDLRCIIMVTVYFQTRPT